MTLRFRGGSMTAGDIAKRLEHAWPTTTRHLRVLEDAQLLTHQRLGRERIYRINGSKIQVIEQWLAWFAASAASGEPASSADATPTPKPELAAPRRSDKTGTKKGSRTPVAKEPAPKSTNAVIGAKPKARQGPEPEELRERSEGAREIAVK